MDLKEIINELSFEIQLYERPIFEEDFKLRESLLKELFLAKKIYAEESNLYSELLQEWLDTFFGQNTLEFVFIGLDQASPKFIDELFFVINNLFIDRRISVSYEKLKKHGTLTKIIGENKYENDY